MTTKTTKGKRDRLIEAAKDLFHQQGVERTTLADVAHLAHVPLGNIYYHFRTKEALVEAVLQTHAQDLQAMFAQWELLANPRQRLLRFLAAEREAEHTLARYGCPYGGLSQELSKADHALTAAVVHLFELYLDWTETQFRFLGKDAPEARELAIDLVSSLQGTFVLANCFRSPDLLEHKLQRLESWIRSL